MMTRSPEKQCRLLAVTMEELIPEDHFPRKLDAAINFDFVYDIAAPLYSAQGRPSIDPVVLVKMLLLGYLYGIDSERKLAEAVRYNIAYRWYLGFDLDEATPDHSTFSQNRRRRFKGQEVFRQIFDQIVARCQEAGLVKEECVVMDESTKILIVQAVDCLNAVYESKAVLRAEIGDVRRFTSKRALVAFAGVDAPPFQSGIFEAKSRHVSKRGSPHLRRTLFQIMSVVLQHSSVDNAVYLFMDKKRTEGKHFYVYMVAGAAKFLRIYYARVKEYLAASEADKSAA